MTPRIYVADLAAYNAGKLHGAWIDANQDSSEIFQAINEMLKKSPERGAEEYAIHDFEGFGNYSLSEYESIETVSKLALAIEEHGELVADVISHVGFTGSEMVEEGVSYLEENYSGEYDSLEDYAQQYLEDTGALNEVPESLRYYFDFEKYARDLEISGDVFTIEKNGKVHVFYNN